MSDPVIAGFDAGQTHTSCRLARRRADGGLIHLAEGCGPGVSHLAAPGGEERFSAALRLSLAAAIEQGGLQGTTPAAAGIGASGIEVGSRVQDRGHQLAASALDLPADRVLVSGDERTALRGAFGDRPGILVISGTGCIAVGRNAEGREHRCGGWGWLLDGGGSAMDIGRDGLMQSVRMADGREPETALRDALWRELAISSAQELKGRVVQADFGAAGFAALAPCIDRLAAAGDPVAAAIIETSAAALVELVSGVAGTLALGAPAVAAVGGAITHLPVLRQRYRTGLATRLPDAVHVDPLGDACHGGLLMAESLLLPG
ncbi:MAG: BadF/BadG/BcrA/BcrD ATPase family protein [Chitinophagaceae bacterium]|nr:BadF/BadG/BcrA/BcrD ATPase family protein [Chitinophagaceae bacterium]